MKNRPQSEKNGNLSSHASNCFREQSVNTFHVPLLVFRSWNSPGKKRGCRYVIIRPHLSDPCRAGLFDLRFPFENIAQGCTNRRHKLMYCLNPSHRKVPNFFWFFTKQCGNTHKDTDVSCSMLIHLTVPVSFQTIWSPPSLPKLRIPGCPARVPL